MMNDDLFREFLKLVTEKLEQEQDEPLTRYSKEYTVSVQDVLTDFSIFATEMYEGIVEGGQNDTLVISFSNGQTFRIRAEEITRRIAN